MIKCPVDGQTHIEVGETPCHQCKADLTDFWRVRELPYVYYNQGVEFAKEGKYGQAEEKLKMFIETGPEPALGYIVLGKVYVRQGRLVEAKECAEKATQAAPDDESIKKGAGLINDSVIKLEKKPAEKEDAPAPKRISPPLLAAISLFGIGMALFLLSSLFGIFFPPGINNTDGIILYVTALGIGLTGMVAGLSIIRRTVLSYVLTAVCSFIALTCTAVFYLFNATSLHYPEIGFVALSYVICILLMAGSVFVNNYTHPEGSL